MHMWTAGLYNVYHTRVAESKANLLKVMNLARELQLEHLAPLLPFKAGGGGAIDDAALQCAEQKIQAAVRQEIVALYDSRSSGLSLLLSLIPFCCFF
jgi:hypothetical protein